MARYQRPDALTTYILNPLITALTKLGLSVRGSHVLAVRGRKTGTVQEVPATGRDALGAEPARRRRGRVTGGEAARADPRDRA
jgi:hypothetical protein